MWLTKIFTALMVVLTGLLPSSCTSAKDKNPATQASAATPTTPVPAITTTSKNQDLGELQLTNRYETCIQLGGGKSCTIKPNQIDKKDLQLTLVLQSKRPDGRTSGLSVVQVTAQSGKSFEVAVGDMNFTLTPRLAAE
jgi:hypothetical protein